MTKRNYVKGEFVFEDVFTTTDSRDIAEGEITRDVDGLLSEIGVGDRTVTINRDVDDVITGWEDDVFEWTLTRDVDGNIESWSVSRK